MVSAVRQNKFDPRTFTNPQIFKSKWSSDTAFGKGNVFRNHGPAHVYICGSKDGKDVRVCADSGCGPTIGNKEFTLALFPTAQVQKRELHEEFPLKVKGGFDGKEYKFLPDYIAVDAFMVTTKGNLLQVKMEIHLSNAQIDSGLLVGTSTLRSNTMLFDFGREVLVAKEMRQGFHIRVPIYFNNKLASVNGIPLRAKDKLEIPAGHEGIVKIDTSQLPERDVWFDGINLGKGRDQGSVQVGSSPVNSSVKRVMVGNFGNKAFTIKAGTILGHLTELTSEQKSSVCRISFPDNRDYFNPVEDFA